MIIILACLPILFSGLLGMYLDESGKVETPALFWLIGAVGGLVGIIIMILGG